MVVLLCNFKRWVIFHWSGARLKVISVFLLIMNLLCALIISSRTRISCYWVLFASLCPFVYITLFLKRSIFQVFITSLLMPSLACRCTLSRNWPIWISFQQRFPIISSLRVWFPNNSTCLAQPLALLNSYLQKSLEIVLTFFKWNFSDSNNRFTCIP